MLSVNLRAELLSDKMTPAEQFKQFSGGHYPIYHGFLPF